MGGLIARAACHPKVGAAEESVLGVVQGVCPTAGAPAVYQRMRKGHAKGIFLSFVKNKVAEIMGKDAAMVTPVLGNSPGALALLPTSAYPTGWLTVDGVGPMPKSNPYAEIYQERHAWWRLVREELLSPATQDPSSKISPWTKYSATIKKVEALFRDTLDNRHHPNTYAHHSTAIDDETVASLHWRHLNNGSSLSAPTGKTHLFEDNLKGNVRVRTDSSAQFSFELRNAGRTQGDGTVPAVSAAVAKKDVRFSAELTSRFEHTESYEHRDVIALTLHNITRMAAEA
jgi:hypothetical protein